MIAKRKIKITKKRLSIDVFFEGNGSVQLVRSGGLRGGVVAPKVNNHLDFNVRREIPDQDGVLNPIIGEDTIDGAFQINIWGDRRGFMELGRYLLGIADIDTGVDPSFHEHHVAISGDGRTYLHIIVRKPRRKKGDGPSKWISGTVRSRNAI